MSDFRPTREGKDMRRTILVLGAVMAVLMFAMVGAGAALADTVFSTSDSPTTKEDCKNGGYAKYGFKNQGQCIKAVNHATPADTTAPPAEIVAGPADESRSNTGFLRFGSTEANVRFECAMREVGTGDPVFAPCDPWPQQSWASSGEFVWAVNAPEATYKFWLRAYDQAGNFTELTRTFTYDRTGPGFTQTSGPSGTINSNTATFEFASSAGDFLRFQCALDLLAPDGSIEDRIESDDNCQSPKTYTNLAGRQLSALRRGPGYGWQQILLQQQLYGRHRAGLLFA